MGELICSTNRIGRQYIWLKDTDSTNSVIKRLLQDGTTIENEDGCGRLIEGDPEDGLIIISDHQNAGRGRSGHDWESEAGTSLAISVLLRPDVTDDSISIVTLVSALAVAMAIKKTCGVDSMIKWPNDLVCRGRKVCGILTELDITGSRKSLILGVGINVNQRIFPKELYDKATSLFIETGKQIDREELMKQFAESLEYYYDIFLRTGDMSALKDEYNSHLINNDCEVTVLDPAENITGIARGINDSGKLLVETPDGIIHEIYAGEVSVRGLYGYV